MTRNDKNSKQYKYNTLVGKEIKKQARIVSGYCYCHAKLLLNLYEVFVCCLQHYFVASVSSNDASFRRASLDRPRKSTK